MLAKYLKNLRASRVVSANEAVSSLGAGWTANGDAVEKEFIFDDFSQASNFMQRFSMHCSEINHTPQWSNVYNKVNVRLINSEFKAVTTKEINIGQYLNTVSKSTLNQDVDDVLSFERVMEIGSIDVAGLLNDQS